MTRKPPRGGEEFALEQVAMPRPRLQRLRRGRTGEASSSDIGTEAPRSGALKVREPIEGSGVPPVFDIPMEMPMPVRRWNVLAKSL